jgi:hypothetical protein
MAPCERFRGAWNSKAIFKFSPKVRADCIIKKAKEYQEAIKLIVTLASGLGWLIYWPKTIGFAEKNT